jgi:hypothetical protein
MPCHFFSITEEETHRKAMQGDIGLLKMPFIALHKTQAHLPLLIVLMGGPSEL